MPNNTTKPKLKPARMITKEKVQEVKDKMADISSTVVSSQTVSAHPAESSEQVEDADVIVPVSQPDSESVDVTENPPIDGEFTDKMLKDIDVHDFCFILETMYNYTADHREEAKRKAREENIRKREASGEVVWTTENAVIKCSEYMNTISSDFNLYREQKNAVAKEQEQTLKTVAQQAETAKRLETVIGRIEDVQGVKAPKRPPFPSWACLAFLFWHWPMYGFAYLWQSKYFRRYCFLTAFL